MTIRTIEEAPSKTIRQVPFIMNTKMKILCKVRVCTYHWCGGQSWRCFVCRYKSSYV